MPASRSSSPCFRSGWFAVVAGGLVLAAVLAVLYVRRQSIGVAVAERYLARLGVPSRVSIRSIGLGGADLSLSLGPAGDPDLSVGDARIAFGPLPPLNDGLKPPPVSAVTLSHVVLRARYADGRLDIGSLQKLVDALAKAPKAAGPAPDVRIEDARIDLTTPGGPATVLGAASLHGGRLTALDARLAKPANVDLGALQLGALGGEVRATDGDDRATVRLAAHLAADTVSSAFGRARGLRADVEGEGPSALEASGPEAPLGGVLSLAAESAAGSGGGLTGRAISTRATLEGKSRGYRDFDGRAHLVLTAAVLSDAVRDAGGEASGANVDLDASRLGVARRDGRVEASATYALSAALGGGRVTAGGETGGLRAARLTLSGDAAVKGGRRRLRAAGALDIAGGLDAASARRVAAKAAGLTAEVASALQQVRIKAPAFQVAIDEPGGIGLGLPQPVAVATPALKATLSRTGAGPVARLASGGGEGAFALDVATLRPLRGVAGRAAVTVGAWRATGPKRVAATFGLDVSGDGLGAKGAKMHAAARLAVDSRGGRFALLDCATAALDTFVKGGRTLVSQAAARLCPAPEPLASWAAGRWAAAAALRDLALVEPDAEVRARMAAADLSVSGGAVSRPDARVRIAGLSLQDAAPAPRFAALSADGEASVRDGRLSVRAPVSLTRKQVPVGVLTATGDLAARSATAVFDTGALAFARQGLQPGDLAPPLARSLPQAEGGVRFRARFDVGPSGVASGGDLSVLGLSFQSPAGRLDDVRGDVRLTGLSPAVSAPAQVLTADKLEAVTPLTGLRAVFTLTPQALEIASASAGLAGGEAALRPMRMPFAPPGAPFRGELTLKDVDAARLIAAFNLSQAVTLNARLAADLPFASGPAGLSLANGDLHAEGPGALSIRRQALGATAASGAMQDFAYQAMENLAFHALTARVDTDPKGRLDVVFHIEGRHEPPQAKPTRVSLLALIEGRAFDKPLPLPKGTPVNLTLATSLNLGDLLAAYAHPGRDTASAPVHR